MSASEKLRALERGITAGKWIANDPDRFVPSLTVGGLRKFTTRVNSKADARFCAELANAFTQIVAVVEAAEVHARANPPKHDPPCGLGSCSFHSTLAALDKALP